MHARALDEAQARLFELHHDEIQDTALGGVALSASLVSTALFPPLVVPLFVGGVTMGILGVRALSRHWDLLDRLADDRDAYAIRQVREYAARDTRMARRAHFAELARSWARPPDGSVADIADELDELARELEDATLDLDPAAALACRRFSPSRRPARSSMRCTRPTTSGPASHGSAPASGLACSCSRTRLRAACSAALSVCLCRY